MNKNILAIAIAAAVAAPSAFAAATVYGNAHMSIDSLSGVANGTNTSVSQTNISSNSSFIGVKGSEDLGGGLKAVFQFETEVRFDGEGDAGKGGTSGGFGGMRNSFAGVAGGFGTVFMGRHDSPIKLVGRKYDLFGDAIGNNRMILAGAGLNVEGRHSNVLAYVTPSFNGFKATLAYVPGAGANDEYFSNAAVKKDAYSLSAGYEAKGFTVDAGYINVDNAINNDKAGTAYRLGAGYTFGAAKVVALYQNSKESSTSNKDRDAYGLGGSYKVTSAGTIKAQYYIASNTAAANNNKNGANMITVGYDHAMSKNTTAYAAYSSVNNDAGGVFSATTGGGHGDTVVANPGKDNSAFSVGLIHKF
jgi:predicted porin